MDVAVVGGGLVGVALASALRRRGVAVTVFERQRVGAGASSAAGGMLGAQSESEPEPAPGTDGIGLRERVQARAEALWWCEQLRADGHGEVGLRRDGILMLARDDAERAALQARGLWQRGHQLRAEWLEPEALRAAQPHVHGGCAGALWLPDDAHVEPRKLLTAARSEAQALGVTLREGESVDAVHHGVDSAELQLEGGREAFARVVVAAGSWSSQLLPEAPCQVKPIRGQVLELRAPQRLAGPVVVGGGAYCIPRDDGRVTVGASVEDVGFDPHCTAAGLQALLAGACWAWPALGAAHFEACWAGFRPLSSAGLWAGPSGSPAVWALTGHFRNGVLLAKWSAERLAQRLLEGERAAFTPQ